MGIGRQSLYNAFGDKHSLFVEAMKHYASRNSQPLIDILRAPGSGVNNIRQALEAIVALMTSGNCCGCLVTNSIVELAPHDEEVAEVVRSALTRVEKAFKDAVDRAVASGEISADTDARAMARFLNNTLHGMVVMGARYGRLWETGDVSDFQRYDDIRKVEPMVRALKELRSQAWVSGLRAQQTDYRKTLSRVSADGTRQKVLPILHWTSRDVYQFMQENDLPQHPLFEQGFSTVGDWHSSRPPSAADADDRDTRFNGLKQECGIHLPNAA
jgi:phosphoadenylyl-sulfate reductase (thioredoxin)